MPKENINDVTADGFRIEVSWLSESQDMSGHLQLATTNKHSEFEFPEERSEGHFSSAVPFDGWHVTLDREGCNRLITSLRHARDKAFGKDA